MQCSLYTYVATPIGSCALPISTSKVTRLMSDDWTHSVLYSLPYSYRLGHDHERTNMSLLGFSNTVCEHGICVDFSDYSLPPGSLIRIQTLGLPAFRIRPVQEDDESHRDVYTADEVFDSAYVVTTEDPDSTSKVLGAQTRRAIGELFDRCAMGIVHDEDGLTVYLGQCAGQPTKGTVTAIVMQAWPIVATIPGPYQADVASALVPEPESTTPSASMGRWVGDTSNPFVCLGCATRALEPGNCAQCAEPLVDVRRPDVQELISDIDARMQSEKERKALWLGIGLSMISVPILFAVLPWLFFDWGVLLSPVVLAVVWREFILRLRPARSLRSRLALPNKR